MTGRQEKLTYIVLALIAVALVAYLGYDVATAYRGDDIVAKTENILDEEPGGEASTSEAGSAGSAIFANRDLLFPIITPEPTPTRVILPTPTPTLIPFAEMWKITALLPNMVRFTDDNGKGVTKSVGDEHFGVLIKEVNAREGYMVVEFIADGRTKTIKK